MGFGGRVEEVLVRVVGVGGSCDELLSRFFISLASQHFVLLIHMVFCRRYHSGS